MNRLQELMNQAQECLNKGDLEGYEALLPKIEEARATADRIAEAQANLNAMQPQTAAMPVTSGVGQTTAATNAEGVDPTMSREYRMAFMNYCQTGRVNNVLSDYMNADEFSTIVETAALIPTTILEEVIKEMKTYGQIFNRIRKLNIKGGVEVPISTVKPVATWITESTPSDRQKLNVSTKVSFLYYGLECKVATSLLADTVTLTAFEALIRDLMAEAFAKALDAAIINGTGSGQPLGITADTRVLAGQIITVAAADFTSWAEWKKQVFAEIPLSYDTGSFIMAKGTFDGYIDGMVDSTGQPIGRVTYGIDGSQVQRFGGKEVILVEDDIIGSYDSALTGDIVAVFVNLSDYAMNTNMQIRVFRWLDQDLNQYVDKMIMIADGKLLDPKGVIIVKKGA